jgi:SRSO17 transposase
MLRRALKSGLPARWVTADEAYCSDHKFRRFIEESDLGYVLAVPCSQRLFLGGYYDRADAFAGELPAGAWKRLSCGSGSKGPRIYDWAFLESPFQATDKSQKGLLIRRSVSDPSEKAYYL